MRWEEKRLDELGQIIDSLHKTPKYSAKGFPMVRVTDIKGGYLKLDGAFKVSEAVFQEFSAKHKSQKGDIVMSRVGTYGVPSLVDSEEPFCLGQNTLFISNTETPKFVFYSLQSPYVQAQIEAKSTGASQKTISLKSIRELAIPCPSLPTQQKIASILSAYDDLIENNLKRIRLLEEAAQHLYREWFVKFRFPGWEEVKVVNGLPEGWERNKIGNELDQVTRKPKIKKDEYKIAGNIPIVDQADGDIGGYTDDEMFKHEYPLPVIVFGDHTRRIKFVDFPFASGADGTQLMYPKNKNLLPAYFYFALKSTDLSNYAYARHFKYLKEEEMLIPGVKILKEFNKTVYPMLNQIGILGTQNQKLKEARDILLPRLMNQTIEV